MSVNFRSWLHRRVFDGLASGRASAARVVHRIGHRFGVAALILGLLTPLAVMAAKPVPSFFNSFEVRSANLKPFKKWRDALGKFSSEKKKLPSGKCNPGEFDICGYRDWVVFLKSIKDKDQMAQLLAVNERINKAKYITDNRNWGQKDYWASPAEFMARFGDCEDYAIMKFLSLQLLGWPDKLLRVVAVKDLNLKVGHAVLVVFIQDPTTRKKTPYVLDNQIKQVIEADRIRHYQPVFSINNKFWWRHVAKG